MNELVFGRLKTQDIINYSHLAIWGDSLSAMLAAPFVWGNFMGPKYGFKTFNGAVPGDTSDQAKVRFDAADPKVCGYTTIIWIGRNNFYLTGGPAQIKSDIAAMVASLGHDRYVVVGITGADTSSAEYAPSGALYLVRKQLNDDLAAEYGDRFFDAEAMFLTLGDGSVQDNLDITRKLIPASVRLDATHFGEEGHAAFHTAIFEKLGDVWPAVPDFVRVDQAAAILAGAQFVSTQPIVQNLSDQGIPAVAQENYLQAQLLPKGTFDDVGRRVSISYNAVVANSVSTKRFTPLLNTSRLCDTGFMTSTGNGTVSIEIDYIMISSDTVRYSARFLASGLSESLVVDVGEIAGLDFDTAIQTLLIVETAGTVAVDDVVMKLSDFRKF